MFNKKLNKLEPVTYALFRITFGFLFIAHGTQKLFGFPLAGHEAPFHVTYIAGPIEMVGGILIMIGLFTQLSAFLASGTMAVAYWTAHGLKAFWPIINGGELAVLYCFAFLYIAARGAGIWSMDAYRRAGHTAAKPVSA